MSRIPSPRTLSLLFGVTCVAIACTEGTSRPHPRDQARRTILVTNDNGIDDRATVALARALADRADVFLVAPATDRSASSTSMPSIGRGSVTVEERDIGAGVSAYAVDGTPADCIVFALAGPMSDVRPDLVISGPNDGSNLADAWVASGTIGAARTAAYLGVPALAVSGVADDSPRSVKAVVDWVVRFVDSPVVRNLRAPEYLTVSLPVVPPEQIRGVEVTGRARGLLEIRAERSGRDDGKQVWALSVSLGAGSAPPGSDVEAIRKGNVAVVAARAGEDAPDLAARLEENLDEIPAWTVGDTVGRPSE